MLQLQTINDLTKAILAWH